MVSLLAHKFKKSSACHARFRQVMLLAVFEDLFQGGI